MPGVPPNPNVQLPPASGFFPNLATPEAKAMLEWYGMSRLGGWQPPRGLLDMIPQRGPGAGQGLLAPIPVMWDRLRTQRGLGLLGAETGYPYAGGGGRLLPQGELPLQGGRVMSRNVRHSGPERAPSKWNWEGLGGGQQSVVTPSGVRVTISPYGRTAEVEFWRAAGGGGGRGSTRRGIQRFSDVFDAVRDYVTKFQPGRIKFTGATGAHDRLYDRVAPMMAKELGGDLTIPYPGQYLITFPARTAR